MKKTVHNFKGFTLAEVLVTLSVIGVVAAMTIPMAFIKIKQHEYKTAGKKAFSVITNTVQSMRLNDGISPEDYINCSDAQKELYFENLQKNMSIINKDKDSQGNTIIYTADGFAYHLVKPDEIYVDINANIGPTKINDSMAQWSQAKYNDEEDLTDANKWDEVELTDMFYIGFNENGQSIVMPYVQNAPTIAYPSQTP